MARKLPGNEEGLQSLAMLANATHSTCEFGAPGEFCLGRKMNERRKTYNQREFFITRVEGSECLITRRVSKLLVRQRKILKKFVEES